VASGRLSSLLALEIELAGRRLRIAMELRALIRLMSTENQLWSAPRIHGELLKFGVIANESMAPSSPADSEPWAFETNRLQRPHLGRMVLPNG
jgi:hypothetical protein